MPRPAVRNIPSPASYVLKAQQKASDLEEQLKKTDANSSAADKLRTPLCEVLSDLILTCPQIAAAENIPERLWRHCFYSKISLQRQLVQKHRRKVQKNGAVAHGGLIRAQSALKDFLTEAAGLYEFLFAKLQHMLPPTTESTTTGASNSPDWSLDEDTNMSTRDNTAGVVDCLQRLALQFGDLYRYSENLHKAQTYYFMAALLGPGYGHACNQLAVVLSSSSSSSTAANSSNNSDPAASQRAVALYWYARSLSTHVPFGTARANLVRLWESNRAWLQQQQQQQHSAAAGKPQSRLFLAHFCELHDLLFRGLTTDDDDDDMWDKMQAFRLELSKLLQSSALGDSLLCKLATIQAFSECFLDRSILADDNKNVNPQQVAQATGTVARTLTLWFGTELVQRISTVLAAGQQVLPKRKQQTSSLRLLLPLLLLTEYVFTKPLEIASSTDEHGRHGEAATIFWQGIVNLLNQLQIVKVQLGLADDTYDTITELQEYRNLRGFVPFEGFLPKADSVLTDDEAVVVLREHQHGKRSSKESASSSLGGSTINSSVGGANQNRLKVARFLWLGRQLVAATGSHVRNIHYDESENKYEWIVGPDEEEVDDGVIAMLQDDDEAPRDSSPTSAAAASPTTEREAKGDSPALLVLGALLKENTEAAPTPIAYRADTVMAVETKATTASPEAMEVVAPAAAASPMEIAQEDPSVLKPFPDVQSATGPPMQAPSMPSVMPPPGFGTLPANPMPALFPLAGEAVPTVAQSYHLFGGLQTSNPFAAPPPAAPNGTASRVTAKNPDLILEEDVLGMDGIPLLDSGLLNSLLMDDTPAVTKNPFAT